MSIGDIHLTMFFVPTWYGPSSAEEKITPQGTGDPAMMDFDAEVARIVREQMAAYQEQMEQRIRELEQTLKEQAAEPSR